MQAQARLHQAEPTPAFLDFSALPGGAYFAGGCGGAGLQGAASPGAASPSDVACAAAGGGGGGSSPSPGPSSASSDDGAGTGTGTFLGLELAEQGLAYWTTSSANLLEGESPCRKQ